MESEEFEIPLFDCKDVECIADDEGFLGAGSSGVVRAGFHKVFGAIAAKCIHYTGRHMEKKKFMQRISDEVKHLQKANTENIVRLYGLVQWQENVAIVTEYLPSGNLMELLSDEVVDIRSFLQLRMGFEIANGLACMHNLLSGQRLVHGDIKAENVLLTDDLHCKIADFGSSILSNYTNNITTNKGEGNYINEFTAIYAAPELLKNNAMALRPSNDTYSFAMILYLILTRKSPVATSCLLKVFLEDVKQGKRPRVDVNTLTSGLVNAAELVIRLLYDVMVKCWTQEAAKRPEMKTVRDELYERMTEIPPHQIHSQVVLASSKMTIVNISKKKHKCVPIDHLLIELSRASNVPESNTETSIASTVFSTFCSTEDVRTKSQLATKTTISQMKSNKQQFCIRPGLEPIDATTFWPIVYHRDYNITLLGMEKASLYDFNRWGRIHQFLVDYGMIAPDSVQVPQMISDEMFQKIHSVDYINSLKSSANVARITEFPLIGLLPNHVVHRKVLKPLRLQTEGSVMAGKLAVEHGWAVNIGGGFHHCSADRGGGGCVFADITLLITCVVKKFEHIKKIMIIDLGATQGNGPERDFRGEENIYILDIYNRNIYPEDYRVKASIKRIEELDNYVEDNLYLELVKRHVSAALAEFSADLIVYNAGTDVLKNDLIGKLAISPDGVVERDRIVFQAARQKRIPIAMLVSGGHHPLSSRVVANSLISLWKHHLLN